MNVKKIDAPDSTARAFAFFHSSTITSDIAITLAPPSSSVELGATHAFHAVITRAGHPDTAVRWSLSGANCATACGSIDPVGRR
jgi:uncharacterized protein YjdB